MNDSQTLPSRLFRPLVWLLFAAPLTLVGAADWPTFCGPDRLAVAPEQGLLKSWPEAGPPLVWKSAGAGRGYASVSIAGGKLYTLGDGSSTAADADEYLSCYDQKSGKPLWATKTGEAWTEGHDSWQSSRGTPTIDAGLVYVVTPRGNLICCDADNGSVVWSRHLVDQLGGKKGDSWGYSESVLVDGDRVICTPGGESATMVALDKKTGETIWQTTRKGDRGAGHSSIVKSQVGGHGQNQSGFVTDRLDLEELRNGTKCDGQSGPGCKTPGDSYGCAEEPIDGHQRIEPRCPLFRYDDRHLLVARSLHACRRVSRSRFSRFRILKSIPTNRRTRKHTLPIDRVHGVFCDRCHRLRSLRRT